MGAAFNFPDFSRTPTNAAFRTSSAGEVRGAPHSAAPNEAAGGEAARPCLLPAKRAAGAPRRFTISEVSPSGKDLHYP